MCVCAYTFSNISINLYALIINDTVQLFSGTVSYGK